MAEAFPYLLFLPPALLIALVCLPNTWVNRRAVGFRKLVTVLVGLQFIVAGSMAIAYATGWVPVIHHTLISVAGAFPIAATVYYDGVASLMLALVSFVGWVICRYSIRYLDGESTQGRYFRWAGFTIGAVSLMVISGNLLMFVATWIMTSLGLHHLLLHYGHRPVARRAAWTKFTISRFGDVALICAMVVLYSEFKTLDFAELFSAARSVSSVTLPMQFAGFLLIAGAVTKSAQFPFHTWLPLTMETPTPVSALMHAGIVNAGGYLIIRTSPLVSLTPWALTTLAVIGAVTACYAAVVMLTQTSVKKSLAYSTIAQMGFMMLQCGLGAFSAAMLHILAHSLYKAHAFLSSGNVISERASTTGGLPAEAPVALGKLVAAASAIATCLGISFLIFAINPLSKPGGLLLGGVICLALTYWVGQVMRRGSGKLLKRAMAVAGGLCLAYSASFVVVDRIVTANLPGHTAPALVWFVALLVSAGFVGMFVLQAALASPRGTARLNQWHIHASNGFYVESTLRRVCGSLIKREKRETASKAMPTA